MAAGTRTILQLFENSVRSKLATDVIDRFYHAAICREKSETRSSSRTAKWLRPNRRRNIRWFNATWGPPGFPVGLGALILGPQDHRFTRDIHSLATSLDRSPPNRRAKPHHPGSLEPAEFPSAASLGARQCLCPRGSRRWMLDMLFFAT